jgi:hypothetical protein
MAKRRNNAAAPAAPVALHRGIFGRTQSGKTAIAKFMVRDAGRAGVACAILDPLMDPDWPTRRGDFITRDRDAFRYFIQTNKSRLVVIDESSKALDRYDPNDDWAFVMGRHLGHLAVVIGQQPKMVNPTIRAQLSKIYVLALPASSAKFLADEWGRPELLAAASFPTLEVMEASGFSDTRRGRIDFASKCVRWQNRSKNVA